MGFIIPRIFRILMEWSLRSWKVIFFCFVFAILDIRRDFSAGDMLAQKALRASDCFSDIERFCADAVWGGQLPFIS